MDEIRKHMQEIFKRAGIPVKEIVLTRVTVIVKLHGAKHADRVASLLRGGGWKNVTIHDDSPSLYYKGKNSPWRVTGILPSQ